MKTLCILLLFALGSASLPAAKLKKVSFYHDTVTDIDGRVIKFLMGLTWLMEKEIVALPLSDGVVICGGPAPKYDKDHLQEYLKALPKSGVLIYDGNTVNVTRVDGVFMLENGLLGKVVESLGDGAILKTEDGSFWSIPNFDRYDTGYWRNNRLGRTAQGFVFFYLRSKTRSCQRTGSQY